MHSQVGNDYWFTVLLICGWEMRMCTCVKLWQHRTAEMLKETGVLFTLKTTRLEKSLLWTFHASENKSKNTVLLVLKLHRPYTFPDREEAFVHYLKQYNMEDYLHTTAGALSCLWYSGQPYCASKSQQVQWGCGSREQCWGSNTNIIHLSLTQQQQTTLTFVYRPQHHPPEQVPNNSQWGVQLYATLPCP